MELGESDMEKLPKGKGGFVCPEHYFDVLPQKVSARVGVKDTKVVFFGWIGSVLALCSLLLLLFLFDRGEEKLDYYSESVLDAYSNEELMEEIEQEDVIDFVVEEGVN